MLLVPESGILAEMYEIHEGVLYSADIYPQKDFRITCKLFAQRDRI